MTRRDFEDLARRIESRYAGRQPALERATLAWVVLGLGGVLAWVGFLLAMGFGTLALGVVLGSEGGVVAIVLGALIAVYALWQAGLLLVSDPPREDGRALRPGEAPALVAMLDELRRELRCQPFDAVRFTMDYNAGVRESPRLGLLGWTRSSLDLGLPLLGSLAPEEFRAVLAHEFAHISARHGRRGHRLYRLRRTWAGVFERLQQPVVGSFGRGARWSVATFANWYWPRLNARALALSRFQEYQADRVAAGVAGVDVMGRALWRIECISSWLNDRFWADLRREHATSDEPPDDVLARFRAALQVTPAPEEAARWVERGRSRTSVPQETHPSFGDRARSLGMTPESFRPAGFPAPARPSAAEALLGDELGPFEAELSAEWKRGESAAWLDRRRRATRPGPASAPAPEAVPLSAAATTRDEVAALWASARETAELHSLAEAAPLLRALLERDPDHAGAAVALGKHLLDRGDPEGERLLLGVVDRDDDQWLAAACETLRGHYRTAGRADRYREFTERLDRHDADLRRAQAERATVAAGDRLLPHGLDESALAPLRALLAPQPTCTAAWLVRKDLKYFPQRPLFLLAVSGPRRIFPFFGDDGPERDLVRRLIPAVELPGQSLIVAAHGPFRALARKAARQAGAEVFRREGADG